MRRRSARLLVALVLAAGCSSDDGDVTASTATPGGPTPAPPPEIVTYAPLRVRVVEPGVGPRALLTQTFRTDRPWAGGLEFTFTIGPAAVTIRGDTELTATSVDEEGTADIDYLLEGLDVRVGEDATSTPDALDIAGGLKVGADRSVRSASVSATIGTELPAADGIITAEAIESILDPRLPALFLPFPQEPVGEGATWQLRGTISLLGVGLDLVGRAELIERDGDTFEMTVTLELTDPERPSVGLEGLGRIAGDLTELGPTEGRIAVAGRLLLPGAPTPVDAALELDVDQR